MQAVSADWDAALRGPRRKTCRVEVWAPGATSPVVLAAKSGQVRVDESSAVRRALTLSLADLYLPDNTPLTPRKVSDLLAPFGTELRVWSGHQYTSGWEETVPVGVFTLTDVDRPSWLSSLQLTAPDRSRAVSLARFLKPYNVESGLLVTAVITALVQRGGVFPVVDLSGSRVLTSAAAYEAGADPWGEARKLAASIGCEVAPDATGVFVIRPVPQVGTPVWTVDVDKTRGALLDIGQRMTAEGVYNAMAVSSSASGTDPVTGYAWVSDGDLAVTRVGWRPTFWSTPIGITTVDQAMAAAAAMLPSKMAAAQILEPVTVGNVALDTGDTIRLSLPVSRDAISGWRPMAKATRINLVPNPRLGVDLTGWISGGTIARTSSGGKWWATAPAGTHTYAQAACVIGHHYSAMMRVRGTPGDVATVANSDFIIGLWLSEWVAVTIPASGEMVVTWAAHPTATTAGTGPYFGIINNSVRPMYLTEAMVEEVSGPSVSLTGDYFDGSSTPDADMVPSWASVVDASVSSLTWVAPVTPQWKVLVLDVVVAGYTASLHPDAQGMTLAVRYPATVTTGTVVTGS